MFVGSEIDASSQEYTEGDEKLVCANEGAANVAGLLLVLETCIGKTVCLIKPRQSFRM